ncbi:MAG: hypothetical protein IJX62_04725 [Clostridia bacterium]|nr:hypothetical protein [Clostridia bacterium]
MTFDETYLRCFDLICRYCLPRLKSNQYLAEEVAKKALDILARDWKTVQFYEEKLFYCWLYGVVENKIHEVDREQAPKYEPLDEEWCMKLVEKQQIKKGAPLDEETEYRQFLDYAAVIERKLEGWERELFHYRVVDGLLFRDVAKRMAITENAAKLRWYRMEEKLKQIVDELLTLK